MSIEAGVGRWWEDVGIWDRQITRVRCLSDTDKVPPDTKRQLCPLRDADSLPCGFGGGDGGDGGGTTNQNQAKKGESDSSDRISESKGSAIVVRACAVATASPFRSSRRHTWTRSLQRGKRHDVQVERIRGLCQISEGKAHVHLKVAVQPQYFLQSLTIRHQCFFCVYVNEAYGHNSQAQARFEGHRGCRRLWINWIHLRG